MRLWLYDRSHSKLVLRISGAPSELPHLDLVFTATEDVRCPASWTSTQMALESVDCGLRFVDRGACVAIIASDITLIVQDGHPDSVWEYRPIGNENGV